MVCFLSPFINVFFLCKIFKFQSFFKCKFPFILQRTFCRRQEYEVREGVLGWEPKTWVQDFFFVFCFPTILLHDFGHVTSLYNISSSFPGCLCVQSLVIFLWMAAIISYLLVSPLSLHPCQPTLQLLMCAFSDVPLFLKTYQWVFILRFNLSEISAVIES